MRPRCPKCFRPLRDQSQEMHDVSCAARTDKPKPKVPEPKPTRSQAGYVAPSRAHMIRRDEYLDSVRKSPDEKRATQRAKTARWRRRRREAAGGTA